MANDLTQITEPAKVLSLPDWLGRLAVGTVDWPGQPTRKYLSGGSTLTAEQRAEAERKRAELMAALSPEVGSELRGAVLAKMVMAYPMAGGAGEAVAQARGEAYLDAVGDLPAWAIREAVRLWNRHACGDQNYSFAPPPAILRGVTENVLAPYRRALERVSVALDAMPFERALDPTPIERAKSLVPNLRVMK